MRGCRDNVTAALLGRSVYQWTAGTGRNDPFAVSSRVQKGSSDSIQTENVFDGANPLD